MLFRSPHLRTDHCLRAALLTVVAIAQGQTGEVATALRENGTGVSGEALLPCAAP